MAEISKLSGVAIANVAKVDAVTKANIANINDLTIPSAAAFLLDTYTGAEAGYSVRRLATATTVLLRVRRDTGGATGDDDEADVAYDSNDVLSLDSAISNASSGVTATTLGQFINVGTVGGTTYTNPDSLTVTASCYVDTWYDQAGSNDAEQATHARQPYIHDGTVNTDIVKRNGIAAVHFDSTIITGLVTTSISMTQPYSTFALIYDYDAGSQYIHGGTTSGNRIINSNVTAFSFLNINAGTALVSTVTGNSGHNLISTLYNGTNSELWRDGTSIATGNAGTNNCSGITIGTRYNFDKFNAKDTIQEVLFYDEAVSSTNRSGIETNITDYFVN